MKIGIITFHKAQNYGAFLQCYALQTHLQKMGAEVSVIDYNKEDIWDSYRIFPHNQFKSIFEKPSKFPSRLYKYIRRAFLIYRRHEKFIESQQTLLNLKPISGIAKGEYDTIFIGSDQVWNLGLTLGFDPFYWGTFDRPKKTKVAAYAASLRSIWDESDQKKALTCLNQLYAISTREQKVADFLNEKELNSHAVTVPDPVLLLSTSDWDKFASCPNVNKKYLFFYEVIHVDRVFNIAKQLAKQLGLEFIYMHGEKEMPNSKCCLSASPAEFVGLIKNAEIVVTSSFHAMVFSMLFGKQFYAVDMQLWDDYRLVNTLSYFGLLNHYVSSIDQCVPLPEYDIKDKQLSLIETANSYINSVINA